MAVRLFGELGGEFVAFFLMIGELNLEKLVMLKCVFHAFQKWIAEAAFADVEDGFETLRGGF